MRALVKYVPRHFLPAGRRDATLTLTSLSSIPPWGKFCKSTSPLLAYAPAQKLALQPRCFGLALEKIAYDYLLHL